MVIKRINMVSLNGVCEFDVCLIIEERENEGG